MSEELRDGSEHTGAEGMMAANVVADTGAGAGAGAGTDAEAIAVARREEMTRKKHCETIALICRQTTYSEEEAETRLSECGGDYMKVISDTLKSLKKVHPTRTQPTTTNQQIYSQIRNFMDTSAKQYEARKKQGEMLQRIEQLRELQAQAQAQAQAHASHQNAAAETPSAETSASFEATSS
jgi:hypothetical protein